MSHVNKVFTHQKKRFNILISKANSGLLSMRNLNNGQTFRMSSSRFANMLDWKVFVLNEELSKWTAGCQDANPPKKKKVKKGKGRRR